MGQGLEEIGGVVWASGPPATADNQHGFKGRGIGIFFADCLGEVAEQCEKIIRDPEGRFLAVSFTLHGRPTLVVAYHADNQSDTQQEAFYKRLALALDPYRPENRPGMDYYTSSAIQTTPPTGSLTTEPREGRPGQHNRDRWA